MNYSFIDLFKNDFLFPPEFDVVHELARRVLAPLSDTGITFSNYLQENEELRDSLEVFVGLLDMEESLSTDCLVTTVERTPNRRDVDSALESVSTHSGEMELDPSSGGEETSGHGSGAGSRNSRSGSAMREDVEGRGKFPR